MSNLSNELKEVTKLRVKAHLGMRSCTLQGLSFTLAKLFLIEDNWAFWETIKKNHFDRYSYWGRLGRYYDAIQKWYNAYSKQERGKNEWLYFGDIKLLWRKEKVGFDDFLKGAKK